MKNKVFITGMGVVTPIGNSLKEFWSSLVDGRSGVDLITRFDTSQFSVKIGAEVKGFDGKRFFSPKEIRRKDRFIQYVISACEEAIKDSKLEFEKEDRRRIGVVVGSGIGGIETWEKEFRSLEVSPRKVSPFFIPMMIINSAPAEISIRYNLKGPNFSTVSACATGAHAIGEAYRLIKQGDADVVITGGSEAAITPLSVAGFANMKALSTRNEEPKKASRPFDRDRDGFVIGEGAGVLILESEEHARRRGIPLYCEVIGYGRTGDAYHITAPDPSAEETARVMELAVEDAEIKKEEVDYINAHGTSTPLNDKIETKAIKKVFGAYAKQIAISSTKSMIGHLLGAAGVVELIATVLTIKNNIIPPTINLENPDPECDLDYTPLKKREKEVNVALSNSFGFGGHNTTIAIRKVKN
jgi:3-oxoacyl-[acyl-carrier-protein] synthase II